MQAVFLSLPEFDRDGRNAIADPIVRPRHVAQTEFGGVFGDGPLEREARFDAGAIAAAGPGADAAALGPAAKYSSASSSATSVTAPRTRT